MDGMTDRRRGERGRAYHARQAEKAREQQEAVKPTVATVASVQGNGVVLEGEQEPLAYVSAVMGPGDTGVVLPLRGGGRVFARLGATVVPLAFAPVTIASRLAGSDLTLQDSTTYSLPPGHTWDIVVRLSLACAGVFGTGTGRPGIRISGATNYAAYESQFADATQTPVTHVYRRRLADPMSVNVSWAFDYVAGSISIVGGQMDVAAYPVLV